jgi:3-methyladenine DNA glycosylase/8-oxoguanine DNA glycosylase
MLTFFRSSDPAHSWVNAVTALLDAANLRLSAIQASGGVNASAWMFYRAATGVLERVGGYFSVRADEAETRVSRAQFEQILGRFTATGVQVVDDCEVAWERFRRRRSQYEPVVDALARLVDAPEQIFATDPD